MSRRARLVFPGLPHHITQRGNYRQKVFENHKDFQKYCYWINQYAQEYHVQILAYCLMSNHVHFIAIPEDSLGLAKLFNTAHMCYSQYKNKQQQKIGHLWQGRFYSSVLDDAYLLRAVRYVERNPVRANIIKKAWEYVWSSAKEHVGAEKDPIIRTCSIDKVMNLMDEHIKWEDYINQDDPEITKSIKEKTQKGLVVGTEKFITHLEQETGKSLKGKKMGRPKK